MAAEICKKRLREEGSCSACLDFFTDPVLLDCGHNFCRACVVQSWGRAPPRAACPHCRETVQAKRLRPNRQLANMVQIAKELSGLPRQESQVCERHQEPLKLFCQEDQVPICLVCDRSREHRAHRVVPVEEAAQDKMEVLRKERENILLYKTENEKESQDLLKQMEAEREKTAAAFGQLHQFLEEQEKLLQTQMEEVEKEIAGRRDKHQASLSAELSALDGLIRELEEKQQQSANEVLQNIGNILERCKRKSFENPVAFPDALKRRIHDLSDKNSFLEGLMKQFQESLVSLRQLQKANVTLDPDTAYPSLILSADCKSVQEGDGQDLPYNPERFDTWNFVLGREGFTAAGRHYWEVDVGSEEEWAVGVARKSVRRNGWFPFSPEGGIWAVGLWEGEYNIFNFPDYAPLYLNQDLKKIWVTLNCDEGQVAFFNADSGAHLHTYTGVSYRETLLPFFYVSEDAHLTLLS